MAGEEDILKLKMGMREHIGQLMMKSLLKMFAVFFIAIQCFFFYPIIGLIAALAAYFTMPSSYYKDEPFRAIEGWFKMLVGGLVAVFLLVILSPGGTGELLTNLMAMFIPGVIAICLGIATIAAKKKWQKALIFIIFLIFMVFVGAGITWLSSYFFSDASPSFSIFFLAIAFFCQPPKPMEREGEQKVVLEIKNTALKGFQEGVTGAIDSFADSIFMSFAIIGGVPMVMWMTMGPAGAASIPVAQVITGLIWLLSFVMGYAGGRDTRPYLGIFVISLAVIAFSFQYTGVVGTNVFGVWWPQVLATGTAIAEPFGGVWDQMSSGMHDVTTIMTCPTCYYAEQEKKQQEANTKVTEGGTAKSIELTEFMAINYAEGTSELDPRIPLVGSMQLENKGTFTARNISIKFHELAVCDPTLYSANDPQKCWQSISDTCAFTACTGTTPYLTDTTADSCKWTEEGKQESLPGDIKLMLFKCAPAGWQDCKVRKETKDLTSGITTYNHSGWQVVIPFDYSFDYMANVSMPIEIMNMSLFETQLMNKQIQLKSMESKYSGGPVKISLFAQKQPLRDNETSFGRISIMNTGNGNVTKDGAKIKLRIPKTLSGIEAPYVDLKTVSATNIDTDANNVIIKECPDDSSYICYTLNLSSQIGPGESANWAFEFAYNIANNLDKKTIAFVGSVDYHYVTVDDSVKMTITQTSIAPCQGCTSC